jgi:hypothetical protein
MSSSSTSPVSSCSLAELLALGLGSFKQELLSPAMTTKALRLAESLPESLPAGFEVRLTAEDDAFDLQQCFLRGVPWPIQGLERSELSELWFEYDDCDASRSSLFLGLDLELPVGQVYDGLSQALKTLGVEACNWLEPFFASDFPARLSHLGFMRSRSDICYRLNFKHLQVAPEAFLQRFSLAWDSSVIQQLTEIWNLVERKTVCLDFDGTGKILPTLGVECAFTLQPPSEPRWSKLLEHLQKESLASAAKCQALLEWPCLIRPEQPWPMALMLEFFRLPESQLLMLERRLSHMKVSWLGGKSSVKAYFGVAKSYLTKVGEP